MTGTAGSGGAAAGRVIALASHPGTRQARPQVLLQRSLQGAPLIGREAELAAVLELLDDPSVRLVTLTGRGGVGKTRLALEACWALDAARPGSVRMVSLANVQESELLLAEIATQTEVPTLPGQPLAAALTRWLDRFPLVLLVDNFEHILGAAKRLTDLLDACADLKLLVTSQARLRLRPERVLHLGPLPVPRLGSGDPASLVDQPAVALYCDRARAVDHRFALNTANAGAVAALCRQLEGVPLAIELAAARATTVPAAQVLAWLPGKRLDVLRSPRLDAPARHQDLRGAIGWTYQLLSLAEQGLLRRLSVIGARFEVEDAEAVAGGEPADALDGLSTLVDLHLVEAVPVGEVASFELTPSIRDFAREELMASGELEATEKAWASGLAGRARSAADGLHAADPDACWDWLDRAHDPLLNALQASLAYQCVDEALDLLAALAPRWVLRALDPAHDQLLERAIEMAERREHHTGALAEAWTWSGRLGLQVLSPDRADLLVGRLRRAEALARSLGDHDRLLRVLERTAVVAWRSSWGQNTPQEGAQTKAALSEGLERARVAVSEGLELARRLDASGWLARFEVQRGRFLTITGDDEAALAACLSGLAHARQANDTVAALDAALQLQTMATRSPEAAAAVPPPQQLLDMARTTHQTAIAAMLLPTFAVQAVTAGDVPLAARWCRQGLELSGPDPSSFLTAFAVFAAVEIAALKGDHELAARLHGRLLDSEGPIYAVVPPDFATAHQTVLTRLRDALDADSFASYVAEGAAVPWPSLLQELDAYLARTGDPQPTMSASPDTVRDHSRHPELTERQREVVKLLARGLTNKEIAQTLGITPKTVMHHTHAIYQSLGVRGRSETVAWAFQAGLAPEPS
jgi:predicted ATPase/DNA-binding CsgD family transcriptional regulator